MSVEVNNKALVHRLYELTTMGDLDAKRELLAPNFVDRGGGDGVFPGEDDSDASANIYTIRVGGGGNLNTHQEPAQATTPYGTTGPPTRPTVRRSPIWDLTARSTPSTPAGEGSPELLTTMRTPRGGSSPGVVVRTASPPDEASGPRGLGEKRVGCSSSLGPTSCPFSPEYVEGEYSDVSRCVISRLHSFDPLGNAPGQLGLLFLRDLERPCPLQHQRSELLLLVGHTGG